MNTSTGRLFVCTDPTESSAKWVCVTVPSAKYETIALDASTANTTYTVAGTFPFLGSESVILEGFQIIASADSANPAHTFDVRVVDVTNGNAVVAEATGFSGLAKQILDLGAVSNVPTTTAVFEVQVRRSGAASADAARVHSATIVCT